MAVNAHLTLTGRQKDGTCETAVTEHSGAAEYFEKNGSCYIFYEEVYDGGDTVIKNIVKLKNSVLELSRRGSISARMLFEQGKEYITDYATPCGCLKMGISTHSLDVSRTEGVLKIHIKYSLTSNGSPVSECSMDITVRIDRQACLLEPPVRPDASAET